jgi:putative Holliday junction resolvase
MPVALGLDVGGRRIGVAIGDPTGTLATPLTTLTRHSDQTAISAIRQLVEVHGAEVIVVGLPLTEEGQTSDQSARMAAFGRKLRAIRNARVVFWDERHSTATASQRLSAGKTKRGAPPIGAHRREAQRRHLDAAAAAVILQDYLDEQQAGD